jgi:membrane-associated protease RseP (regulator of RpoE activity)
MIAAQRTFGRRGDTLHIKLRRAGADLDVNLVRAPQTAPPGPKSSSMFVSIKPLINWRNQFIPCMGAGPAGFAAISYCDNHFKSFGFIKTGELGSTGFQLDLARVDSAVITTVDPGSPAAQADIRVGDEIVEVENQPLAASGGQAATEGLFGKAGDQFHITVHSGQSDKTVALTLAAKPSR